MTNDDSGDLFTLRRSDVEAITCTDTNLLALYIYRRMNPEASDDELMCMLDMNISELFFAEHTLNQRLELAKEFREYDPTRD